MIDGNLGNVSVGVDFAYRISMQNLMVAIPLLAVLKRLFFTV